MPSAKTTSHLNRVNYTFGPLRANVEWPSTTPPDVVSENMDNFRRVLMGNAGGTAMAGTGSIATGGSPAANAPANAPARRRKRHVSAETREKIRQALKAKGHGKKAAAAA
jgi:hypothetical protein